jgi:hypothetical protein
VVVWAKVAQRDHQKMRLLHRCLGLLGQDAGGEAWRGGKKCRPRSPFSLGIGESESR